MPATLSPEVTQHRTTTLRDVERQFGIPVEVTPQQVAIEKSLGAAIGLCIKSAGLEPKQVAHTLSRSDKSQISRWISDGEGIMWPKFVALMDLCGNDAPLLWMLHARGYDLGSMRKRETELQRENRVLREERDALRRVLTAGGSS